jgi:hypothetical protein
MNDPSLGTRALTGEALDAAADIVDLLARLEVTPGIPGQLA